MKCVHSIMGNCFEIVIWLSAKQLFICSLLHKKLFANVVHGSRTVSISPQKVRKSTGGEVDAVQVGGVIRLTNKPAGVEEWTTSGFPLPNTF